MIELEDVAEAVESAAMARWYSAGASVGAPVRVAQDGRVHAFCFEGSKDILLNRVLGLGLGLNATREGVDATLGWFRARNAGRFLMHVSPNAGPSDLRDWLVSRGLRRHRAWMKFARDPGPVQRPQTELRVRRVGRELGDEFARIVAEVFHMPGETRPLLSTLVELEGWHAFMSFAGETPVGTGALFVSDGAGWLALGATRPEFRGRGGQAAVMATRLEAAFDLGARVVITETGEAVPGDAQHSYKNILKAGFRELYLRENFVGEGDLEAVRGER